MKIHEALFISILLLLLSGSCTKGSRIISAEQKVDPSLKATNKILWDDGQLITAVKPLDDSQNPYRDGYHEWDRWVWNHILKAKPTQIPADPNWNLIFAYADRDGNLVPLLEYERQLREAWKQGRSKEFLHSWKGSIYAAGVMDPELRMNYEDALWKLRASYYPKFPKWVAQNPPAKVMVLPDGRVACVGEAGQTMDQAMALSKKQQPPLYLYNNSGTMLSSNEGGAAYLYDLLNPDFAVIRDKAIKDGWDRRLDMFDLARQGYLGFEKADGTLLYIYDIDGKRIANPPPPQDEHNFIWIDHAMVTKLAVWQ